MKRLTCGVVLLVLAVLAVGCGTGGPKAPSLAKVSGKVNLDGNPMNGGTIRFTVDGQPPKAIEVKDGAFSGEVFSGKNKVEIVLLKDGGPHPMNPSEKLKVNTVADKFSGPNTVLNADVPQAGSSDLKFDVTSKK